jgi:hypothetical protein
VTGDQCYEQLQPYLPAALSLFAITAQEIAHDIAVSNPRGKQLAYLLQQRVIEGSAEHNFEYWKVPPDLRVLLDEADEELIDAIVYFALWYMTRGKTI